MATKKSKSLKDDLEAPPVNYYGGLCKMKLIYESLDPDDQESLLRSVEKVREDRGQGRSRVYSAQWLTKILKKNGHDISSSTVLRHVNKECPCERIVG